MAKKGLSEMRCSPGGIRTNLQKEPEQKLNHKNTLETRRDRGFAWLL